MTTECIPILQTEVSKYWGLSNECVWNETVIFTIIFIIFLLTVIDIITTKI